MPPHFIVKGKRRPHWFEEKFLPFTASRRSPTAPVILILDNLSGHVHPATLQNAKDNNVVMVGLYTWDAPGHRPVLESIHQGLSSPLSSGPAPGRAGCPSAIVILWSKSCRTGSSFQRRSAEETDAEERARQGGGVGPQLRRAVGGSQGQVAPAAAAVTRRQQSRQLLQLIRQHLPPMQLGALERSSYSSSELLFLKPNKP